MIRLLLSVLTVHFLLINSSCSTTKSEWQTSTRLIELDSNTNEGDVLINDIISTYKRQLQGELNDTLMFMEKDLMRSDFDTTHQNLLWNWVSDGILAYAVEEMNWEVSACLLNSGGLRKDIPKGIITVKDIFELMPFDNYLVRIQLNPKGVDEMIDYLMKKPQPSSGLTFLYNGDIISDITFSNKINEYSVLTINYLADGGDEMNFWKSGQRADSDILLRDAMIWYCRKYPDRYPSIDMRTRMSN